MQRNFSLDCFRALAIMLVFTGHSILAAGSPASLAPLQFGGTGVDLFFVLSGWLIGNQLLIEQKTFGNIEVSRFWVRRWMRTVPAYYAVLTVTILQLYLTKEEFSFPWAHLLFIQNYVGDLRIFFISWSLSVEEQFYLFIAPFIVFGLKLSTRHQVAALLALLLCPSVFRFLELYENLSETHVRLDCCAMGVLLAYLKHYNEPVWDFFTTKARGLFIITVSLYIFFYWARYNPTWGITDPSKLTLAILFGAWIVWSDQTTFCPQGFTSKVVMHISTRSYAMYLLHVDALALIKKIGLAENFFVFFVCTLILTLFLSECLYRLIELPFMRARSKFSISKPRRLQKQPLGYSS